MIDNLEILEPGAVHHRVHELIDAGYRYVTVTACTNPDDTYDLFYSFDKDYKLVTLKTTIGAQESIPSVSNICIAAAFAENEISELFGVKINGMAIDYGGHFILSEGAPDSPFGAGVILVKKGAENNAR